jgi:spore coat protein CotH
MRQCEAKTCILGLLLVALAAAAPSAEPPRAGLSLTNFEPSVPLLYLEAKEQIVSERKVPCSVRLVLPKDADSESTALLPAVVRFHGASSQMYPKKSFAVTLAAPAGWLGMRESTQWVINAAFVDRSLMRHKLSYDLFRALSAPGRKRFAAESRFVEVNLNGRYHGAYLLMERVDWALLELRRFDRDATNHACIYKAEDHGADFARPGHGAYEQREPDPLVLPYWGPLDRFSRFVSTAKDTEFFDANSGIASRLDLDNTIDFHLLILLTSNMDGHDKNIIFARDAPSADVPQPRFFFAPWDYDATFGRNWNATRVEPTEWLSNHLFDRLLNDATYRKKFVARWRQLREREFSGQTIQRMIDDNVRTLSDAAKRNALRWRTLSGAYPDRLTFEQDIAEMREWITARLTWLDDEIRRRGRETR